MREFAMIEAAEALGTCAQVAITLAGFAGVVVVFGSGAVHEWSSVDKFRLRLMLLGSAVSLSLCMFGLLALASDLPQPVVWRLMSGLVVALLLPGLIVNINAFRRFSPEELRRTGASRATFYATSGSGFAVVLLQICNALATAVFWPFFLAIVLSILISTLQFARLILARRE